MELLKIDDFDEIFEIMEKSFPATERRERAGQRALFENKYYRVLGEKREGRLAGFLAFWEFEDVRFLEHLATSPEQRNGGIGRSLLSAALSLSDKRVILEVEPACDEITERRINYYKRLGFTLNAHPYIQPSMAEGQPAIPLHIMSTGGELGEDEYEGIKRMIYREVYGIL